MPRGGLGDLERKVLAAILRLNGEGYAVSIAGEIETRLGKPLSLGAVYATVDRMEGKGLISSRLGEPTAVRGGKPKRFYQIEAPGLHALSDARESDRLLWSAMPPMELPA